MSALAKLDALALLRPDAMPLFSDLSLTIGPARYGLVGRNGCGKSSLLRLLAGEPLAAAMTLWGFAATFALGAVGTGLALLPYD